MKQYSDFLARRNQIAKDQIPREMGTGCLQLLDLILIAITTKGEISVGDATAFIDVGSPATVHKKLQILRNADFITALLTTDKRTKVIKLTDKAQTYYSAVIAANKPAP